MRNTIEMEDHPLKALLSVALGFFAGIHSIMLQAQPDQVMALAIACGKAFMVGGCAWLGQTGAAYTKKRIIKTWKKYKDRL